MELRQLKTFRTVATLLSFHRAAGVLNYAQSTVSAQIRALEDDLGVKLFDRLGKRIVLTQAGELLVQYAQKMLDIEAETLAEVRTREQAQGSLSIRIPQTVGIHYLPRILAVFRNRFPLLSLHFHTCAFHALEHELQTGTTDLAFLLAESVNSPNLTAEPLRYESLVLVVDPGNPLAERSRVCLRDLEDQPLFLAKSDCGYRMVFEQLLMENSVECRPTLEFSSVEVLRECLKTGPGVAFMPEISIRKEVEQEGTLVILPWDEGPLETAILMIRHKDKWQSPALRAFMNAARQAMKLEAAEGE
jgi:DNA-binding transcriptional LysR family regulator